MTSIYIVTVHRESVIMLFLYPSSLIGPTIQLCILRDSQACNGPHSSQIVQNYPLNHNERHYSPRCLMVLYV